MPSKFPGAGHVDCWRWPAAELDQIDNTKNLRWKLIPSRVEEMAWRLSKQGQLQPGEVRMNAQKRAELVAGFYRLAGAKLIRLDPSRFGLKEAIGFVARSLGASEDQAIDHNLSENLDRTGYTLVDLAHIAQQLEEVCGWERKMVAERLKCTATRVGQLRNLMALPERVLDLIHQGRMGEALGRQLLGLSPEQIASVADDIEAGRKPALLMRRVADLHRARGESRSRSLSEVKEIISERFASDARAFALLQILKGDPTVSWDEVFPPLKGGR